jgi:hypothetical protein
VLKNTKDMGRAANGWQIVLGVKKLNSCLTVSDQNVIPLVETPKQKAQHAKCQAERSHNPGIAGISHERDYAAGNETSDD